MMALRLVRLPYRAAIEKSVAVKGITWQVGAMPIRLSQITFIGALQTVRNESDDNQGYQKRSNRLMLTFTDGIVCRNFFEEFKDKNCSLRIRFSFLQRTQSFVININMVKPSKGVVIFMPFQNNH